MYPVGYMPLSVTKNTPSDRIYRKTRRPTLLHCVLSAALPAASEHGGLPSSTILV